MVKTAPPTIPCRARCPHRAAPRRRNGQDRSLQSVCGFDPQSEIPGQARDDGTFGLLL